MSDREPTSAWKRVVVGVFLLFGIFFLPWYLVIALNLVSILAFPHYVEAVFIALIYEILYSRINDSIFSLKVFSCTLIVFALWELLLRSRLRLARNE